MGLADRELTDQTLWYNRSTKGSPYTADEEAAIESAMLGSKTAWIDTIAAGVSVLDPVEERQGTGSSRVPAGRIGLSAEDLAAVEQYWDAMTSRFGLWWELEVAEPDEQGYRQVLSAKTLELSHTNLEQGTQAKGFSDLQISWLADRLVAGPESLSPEQVEKEGLFGQPDPPGGGGRGSGGPKYVAPMREVIEDTVKAMLTALTGDESDALVQKYSDVYAKSHRQQWDVARSGGTDIDPNQVLLEAIRDQEDYKRIHTLRSASESETRWISDRTARLTQLGMTSQDADDRAVWLAQAGTNLNDIDTGAAQMVKGRKDITLFKSIERAASQVAGQL